MTRSSRYLNPNYYEFLFMKISFRMFHFFILFYDQFSKFFSYLFSFLFLFSLSNMFSCLFHSNRVYIVSFFFLIISYYPFSSLFLASSFYLFFYFFSIWLNCLFFLSSKLGSENISSKIFQVCFTFIFSWSVC